ncbi:MAG: ThiF family adenylyltransferase [Acidobacteriota bacterium]
MTPDLSFLKARTFLLAEHRAVQIILVGCGGTGSYVARAVAQVGRVLLERGLDVRIAFADPDVVEPKNIPRQLFADAELGEPKAVALARRYGAAWGVPIEAHHASFSEDLLAGADTLRIIVGCVDNARARKTVAEAVTSARRRDAWMWRDRMRAPLVLWLDCGNDRQSGQVLLGTTSDAEALARACALDGFCTESPLPTLQAPELLVPRDDERARTKLSCAELMALNLQALSVNARVAAEAGDVLMRLLVTHDLRRFATYFDLPSGTSRSSYFTPETIASCAPPSAKKRSPRRAA